MCIGSDWTSHFTVGGFAFSIYFLTFKRENGRGSLEKKKRGFLMIYFRVR